MSTLLSRLGRSAALHPWRVIVSWLAVLGLAVGLALLSGGTPKDDYREPSLASQAGIDFLVDRFGDRSGTDARVVVHAADGTVSPAALTEVSSRLESLEGVSLVEPPRLSADGDTALITVQYDIPVTDFSGSEGVDALEGAVAPLRDAGMQVELGGQVPENISAPSGLAEAIGFLAALIILAIAFGAVIAAGLPLAVALVGLGVGTMLVTVLASFTDVSTIAPTIASMVGIGVGIDYALLLVTRYSEGLRSGLSVPEAAARANGTAGMSVIFAGTTVFASLLGLRLAGLPTYESFGYATLLVVLAVMLTAITLVPALCGLFGYRVLRKRDRAPARAAAAVAVTPAAAAPVPATNTTDTVTGRWAERIGRRPWPWALGALALLLLLAAPVLGMRTWPQDASSKPDGDTSRVAYDLVAEEFGAGANGPIVVAVDLAAQPDGTAAGVISWLQGQQGIAGVAPAVINPAGDAAVVVARPTTGPQDEATTALLDRLRESAPRGAMVTGLTATFADIADRLAERLWWVVAFVVTLSVLLLTVVFRAPVVALKAAVLNLLSVAAAYGVMVAIFQWGWGAELVGLPHAVPVSSWVPILMFTILFGLSMDYQVFLLSRIREDYLATGDPRRSVVRGLASTGRVITSAAAIMIAVFLGFALDADPTVKMMGVGMAVAVLIDATLVRMVLVPATMALLGSANWWLPGWLDRVLPHLDVEGRGAARRAAGPTSARLADGTAGPTGTATLNDRLDRTGTDMDRDPTPVG